MKIRVGRCFSAGERINPGIIETQNGLFSGFCADGEAELDLSAYITLPGFVDMHTHGGSGLGADDASIDELDEMSRFYAASGVAEFCATTVTNSVDNLVVAEKRIVDRICLGTSGANIAGIYLEGPFLSHQYKGAHEESLLALPTKEDVDRLLSAGQGHLRVLAVAPELPGALEVIEYAVSKGIKVSCGHSAATAAEANAGFDKGASIAIHTYNCMPSLHHREPGILGASLVRDDAYGEIICDFLHVAPEPVKIAIRCKGKDRIVFITDSIAAAGLPDGEHMSGPLPIIVKDGVARTHGGNLAGSSLRTNEALRNVVKTLGIPLEDAMLGVTKNPAQALGMYDKFGSIDVGKRAHLTVLDDDFNVVMTIVDGKVVYKA